MVINNIVIPVTKQQSIIMMYLLSAKVPVQLETIGQYLFTKTHRKVKLNSLRTAVIRLRRKIRNYTGIPVVQSRYGIGYWIDLDEF